MLFTSPVFLFLFLPLSILLYQCIPHRLSNLYLLIISIVFYGWSEPAYLPIILLMGISDWAIAKLISNTYISTRNLKLRQIIFLAGIMGNIALLVICKYIPHLIKGVNFPLGISFLTFISISYLIDIYRESAKSSGIVNTSLYLLFFPQVSAGPITQYRTMFPQLVTHKIIPEYIYQGITRIIYGLSQKLLLANAFGLIADQFFGMPPERLVFNTAWLGVIAYTFQIYFDFAGYSDIAIGVGLLFGFKLSENFNFPYRAHSITDFWSRWHISLTSWLREYVYIPLGGSRRGRVRTYANILIIFIVSGLWHGVGWRFLVWGLWHAFFMIIERIISDQKRVIPLWTIGKRMYVAMVVCIGWIIFRSNSLSNAGRYISILFHVTQATLPPLSINIYMITLFGVGFLLSLGVLPKFPAKLMMVKSMWLCILLFLSILCISSNTYNSFIYTHF